MSVVFPNPAGAEIRVSGCVSPWLRRARRRGRGTSVDRGGGKKSLVESSVISTGSSSWYSFWSGVRVKEITRLAAAAQTDRA